MECIVQRAPVLSTPGVEHQGMLSGAGEWLRMFVKSIVEMHAIFSWESMPAQCGVGAFAMPCIAGMRILCMATK
jgi:hypothetical protein